MGFRSLIRELLERAQAAGEARAELDAESTSGLILALLEGAVLLDKTNQSEHEIQHALEFIASYLRP